MRRHSDGVPTTTLPTYRNRYAQYRLDPDLQNLHARAPALVTWDDHEVENDYADQWSQWFVEPARFLLQRAAAYQAFYEHMPVRPIVSHPQGPVMRVYDRFTFGDLIEISMIDGRQYRSREACYGPPNKGGGHLESNASCPERLSAGRTMMGFAQESWLYSGLAHSKAQWNVIAQDVLMALSPSNSLAEMNEKRALYFEAVAHEVWICGLDGKMEFFASPGQQVAASRLCPLFPGQL